MNQILNITDLPESDVKVVTELIELLRIKNSSKPQGKKVKEKISFSSYNIGVKDKIAREDIYEYL